jgi:hypothetical protein
MAGKRLDWQGGASIFTRSITLAAAATAFFCSAMPAVGHQPPSLFRMFGKKVEASEGASYSLDETRGPWLVLAATFGGEEGQAQANALLMELRSAYNMAAYLHKQHFDYAEDVDIGQPQQMRRRHANASSYDTFTVLVGDFASPDDAELRRTLDTLKYAQPASMDTEKTRSTSQMLGAFRQGFRQAFGDDEARKKGPMYQAFATRNPMLPREYILQSDLDDFVERLNSDLEYSLVKATGKYTVVVKSFEGSAKMQVNKPKKQSTPEELLAEEEKATERMNRWAVTVHEMTIALREQNVEAYEYHNRTGSFVCIGSFDELGSMGSDGEYVFAEGPDQVMKTYKMEGTLKRVAGGGLAIEANTGGVAVNKIRIPFDLKPRPMAIPKPQRRSLLSRTFGSSR